MVPAFVVDESNVDTVEMTFTEFNLIQQVAVSGQSATNSLSMYKRLIV